MMNKNNKRADLTYNFRGEQNTIDVVVTAMKKSDNFKEDPWQHGMPRRCADITKRRPHTQLCWEPMGTYTARVGSISPSWG